MPQLCNESSAEWNSVKIFRHAIYSQTCITAWNLFRILSLLHAAITFFEFLVVQWLCLSSVTAKFITTCVRFLQNPVPKIIRIGSFLYELLKIYKGSHCFETLLRVRCCCQRVEAETSQYAEVVVTKKKDRHRAPPPPVERPLPPVYAQIVHQPVYFNQMWGGHGPPQDVRSYAPFTLCTATLEPGMKRVQALADISRSRHVADCKSAH